MGLLYQLVLASTNRCSMHVNGGKVGRAARIECAWSWLHLHLKLLVGNNGGLFSSLSFFFQLCFSFLHSSEQASHYQRNMLWLVLHLISPLMSSVCLVTAQTAEDGVYILTDPPLCVLLTFNSANISLSNVRLRNLKYSWEDKNVLQVQPAGLLHGLKCVFCYKWVGLQGRRFIRIWTLIT